MKSPLVNPNASTDARLEEEIEEIKSKEVQLENALKQTWQYYVKEGHLPTGSQALLRDILLLLFSGGSGLYFLIVKTYVEDKPEWLAQSYLYSTMISAASILINTTNEFFLLRSRRHYPAELQRFNFALTKRELFLKDLSVVLVSAIASLSLTTAAWRYSASWPAWLRRLFTGAIQGVNTGLHFLPVELVAFNPPYDIPLRPFQYFYKKLQCPTEEQKQQADFMAFKCRRGAKLIERLTRRLDRALLVITNKHFTWQPSSLAYIGKKSSSLQQLLEADDMIPILKAGSAPPEEKAKIKDPCGKLILGLLYCIGAAAVILGQLGFVADPFTTLGSGIMGYLGLLLAGLAAYYFCVLLAHMGGSSLQTIAIESVRIAERKASMPLVIKMNTKTCLFLVIPLIIYMSLFASASAEQMAMDHFGGRVEEPLLIWAAKIAVAYFTFTNLFKLYTDYSEKFARLYTRDSNHVLAVLKQRIEDFKRHVPSNPDALAASFKQYPEQDLELLLGMNLKRLKRFTAFDTQYKAYNLKQSSKPSCWQNISNFFKHKTEAEQPLLPVTELSTSLTLSSFANSRAINYK